MLLHAVVAYRTNGLQGCIIIQSPDSDLLILALHYFCQVLSTTEMWIKTGTVLSTADIRCYIPLRSGMEEGLWNCSTYLLWRFYGVWGATRPHRQSEGVFNRTEDATSKRCLVQTSAPVKQERLWEHSHDGCRSRRGKWLIQCDILQKITSHQTNHRSCIQFKHR